MAAVKKDFEILIGSTWEYVIRWGTTPIGASDERFEFEHYDDVGER